MAVRVWREWLAVSLVLAAVACSGKSGQRNGGDDPGEATGATSTKGGGPGKIPPGPAVGGSPSAPSAGGAFTFGGEPSEAGRAPGSAGAPPVVAGAGGAGEDEPGIVVTAPGDHMVHESYGTVQMQVLLTAQPAASVEVKLLSTDPTHAVVYPLSLTFTPENWSTVQVAVVVGVRDTIADDGHAVTIETLPAVSADPRYVGLNAADVDVFVIDETDAAIVVGPTTGGVTSESGTTMTFNIVLTSQPTATVTIPLSSSDLTEGTVPASVVFKPSEWSTPHPVTVTGVDDAVSDGTQVYDIVTGTAVSDDAHYAGIDPVDVHLSNTDNE